MYQLTEFELSNTLKKLPINNTQLLCHWETILEDEEYFKEKQFIRCPYCDCTSFQLECVNVPRPFCDEIFLFLKNLKKYNADEIFYWNDKIMLNSLENKNVMITYCNYCKSLLKINDKNIFIVYGLVSSDIENILIKDEYLDKKTKFPMKCPHCNSTNFFKTQDNHRNNLSNIYCSDCKNYIISKYDNRDCYHININNFTYSH